MLLAVLDRQNSNRGEPLAHHQPAEHPDALTHTRCARSTIQYSITVSRRLKCLTGLFKAKVRRKVV